MTMPTLIFPRSSASQFLRRARLGTRLADHAGGEHVLHQRARTRAIAPVGDRRPAGAQVED
jgi:hypothetical protein